MTPVDDIIETMNNIQCFDYIFEIPDLELILHIQMTSYFTVIICVYTRFSPADSFVIPSFLVMSLSCPT